MARRSRRPIILHLRQVEKVDAVISIGHRFYEDDVKLAQDVPGIDVILGTHSHRKEDLKQIPGTNTWIISPFQYFEYVSRVELTFEDGTLATRRRRAGPDGAGPPGGAGHRREGRRDAARPGGRSAVRRPLRAAGAGGGRAVRREHQQRRVGAGQLGPGHRPGGGRRPGGPLDGEQLPRLDPARRRDGGGLPDGRAVQEPGAGPRDDRRPASELAGPERQQARHGQLLAGERRALHDPGRQGDGRAGAGLADAARRRT